MSSRSNSPSLAPPLYQEKKIAAKLGVTRVEMRLIRKAVLKKRKHWTIAGREVVISQAALEKVLEYLASTSNAAQPADFHDCVSNGADEKQKQPQEAEQLTVKRVYPNPRLLLATDPTGAEVRVRVRDNRNFTPKMKLAAVPTGDGLYQMQGRCPRYKGRY